MSHTMITPLPIGATLDGGKLSILTHEGYDGWAFVYTASRKYHRDTVWLHELAIEELGPARLQSALAYPAEYQDEAQEAAQSYLREAQKCQSIRVKYLTYFIAAWEENGTIYVGEAYRKGTSLKARLRRTGAMPQAEALTLLSHVSDAMISLHAHGICHGQLNPAHVWLTDDGYSMLRGVGEAKQAFFRRRGRQLDKLPSSYAALELLRPDGQVSIQTDLYSLGALSYHLLASTRPEPSTQRITRPMPEAQHFAPISDHLNRVITKAIALKPEDRYADIDTFHQDLTKNYKPQPRPAIDLSGETAVANRIFWVAGLIALGIILALVLLSWW